MEKKFTFFERLLSATPSFFKRAQTIGLTIAGLGATLTQVPFVPANITAILISAGTAIAAIAQFAVKQYEPGTAPAPTPKAQ